MTDLLAGRIDIMFDNLGNALQYVRSGKVKAIAIAAAKRVAQLPQLPAISETYPGFESTSWYVVVAPPHTPAPVVAKLSQTIAEILREPEVGRRLNELSLAAVGTTPEQTAAFIRRERVRWRDAVSATLAKIQ